MKSKCGVFFGYAVVLTAAIVTLAGCENGTTDLGPPTISDTRYETVLYRPGGARAADEEPPYKLVAAVSVPSTSSYFYRYYMGYVKSVPISYKTAYLYGGTTPITISWEKSVLNESAVMNSMKETQQHTWGASLTVTTSVQATVGTGDSSPIKAELQAGVSVAVGGSYGGSIATESTYETTETFTEGQNESITATIGEHDEAPGKYRYALFGSTDVYYEVEIDSNTREVKKAEIIQCARYDTLAWGIDFTPLGQTTEFGKTGGGDEFEIPDIDFAAIDAPTKVAEEIPEPPSQYKKTSMTISTGGLKGNAEQSGKDGDVNSQNGRKTDWEFKVNSMTPINVRGDGTYGNVEISFTYTVKEGQSNWTVLTLTTTYTVDVTNRKVTEVITSASMPQKLTGTISGKHHDWVTVSTNNNEVIKSLRLKIDDTGDDKGNIAFDAQLDLQFLELNS